MTHPIKASRRPFTHAFFRRNRFNFILDLISYLLMVAVSLGVSWLIQQLLDTSTGVSTQFTFGQLLWFSVGLLGLIALAYLLQGFARPRFLARAMGQYKEYAFSKLTEKSIASFSTENTATYISALSNDLAAIETGYLRGLTELVYYIVLFFGALIMMLCYSPLLTFAAIGMSLLPVAVSLLTGNRLATAEQQVSRCNEGLLATLRDSLNGFAVIKSFRAEKELLQLFRQSNRSSEQAKSRRNRLSILIEALGSIAGNVAQIGVFLLGGYLTITGRGMTGGVLIVFVQLMNYIIFPISKVPALLASRKAAIALIDKLAGAIFRNVREEGEAIAPQLSHEIAVEQLTFGYEEHEPVLQDLSVRFEAGKSYAIVGASGSGKSTLLNLLMAAHSGYQGSIRYDGKELRDISTESLYDLLSIIQQNVFIFNASIRDNVTMFRDFDDGDVARAMALSGLSKLVEQRGEDYLCGENGCGLSGGERQRIAIARSLLRKSSVLLVDEATAALDALTAHQVSSAILQLDGLTRIVVTHSLEEGLLEQYDCILTLKQGQVVERGSFAELMNRRGYFYSLFTVSQ